MILIIIYYLQYACDLVSGTRVGPWRTPHKSLQLDMEPEKLPMSSSVGVGNKDDVNFKELWSRRKKWEEEMASEIILLKW